MNNIILRLTKKKNHIFNHQDVIGIQVCSIFSRLKRIGQRKFKKQKKKQKKKPFSVEKKTPFSDQSSSQQKKLQVLSSTWRWVGGWRKKFSHSEKPWLILFFHNENQTQNTRSLRKKNFLVVITMQGLWLGFEEDFLLDEIWRKEEGKTRERESGTKFCDWWKFLLINKQNVISLLFSFLLSLFQDVRHKKVF